MRRFPWFVPVTSCLIVLTCTPGGTPAHADETQAIRILRSLHVDIKTDDKTPGKPAIEARLSYDSWSVHAPEKFAPLQTLRSLKKIKLQGLRIDDDFLEYLADLPNLESIHLVQSFVHDKGIQHLSRLKNLRELNLSFNTYITDRGIRYLGRLTNLEELRISYSPKLTGAGLAGLRRLRKLRNLDLEWSNITDDGVRALAAHPGMESLSLIGCPITDQSLEYCKSMTNLRDVAVYDTEVTAAGVRSFRKARPAVKVYGEGRSAE
jgi:hypothetical protein